MRYQAPGPPVRGTTQSSLGASLTLMRPHPKMDRHKIYLHAKDPRCAMTVQFRVPRRTKFAVRWGAGKNRANLSNTGAKPLAQAQSALKCLLDSDRFPRQSLREFALGSRQVDLRLREEPHALTFRAAGLVYV